MNLFSENSKRGDFLYDVLTDPDGLRNLLSEEPERAAELARLLRIWRLKFPQLPVHTEALSESVADALRGLGYVVDRPKKRK